MKRQLQSAPSSQCRKQGRLLNNLEACSAVLTGSLSRDRKDTQGARTWQVQSIRENGLPRADGVGDNRKWIPMLNWRLPWAARRCWPQTCPPPPGQVAPVSELLQSTARSSQLTTGWPIPDSNPTKMSREKSPQQPSGYITVATKLQSEPTNRALPHTGRAGVSSTHQGPRAASRSAQLPRGSPHGWGSP